jgi:protein SCO1/2
VKKFSLLILILAFCALALSAYFYRQGRNLDPIRVMGQVSHFSLTDENGQQISEAILAGKTSVVDFFFTRCQGPCPQMSERLSSLQKQLPKGVSILSISMDPSYDTPEVLKEYGQKFSADFTRWHFLTGKTEVIVHLATEVFHLAAGEEPDMHSTRFMLVDGRARIRGYYDSTDDEAMRKLVSDAERVSYGE